MNYEDYSVQDFIHDEFFQEWVINPNAETEHFWKEWMKSHPDNCKTINKARTFIESIGYKNEFKIDDVKYSKMFERIMRFKHQYKYDYQDNKQFKRRLIWVSTVAASIALLAIFWNSVNFQDTSNSPNEIKLVERSADKGTKYSTVLPDGSKIKLNAESTLRYPEQFVHDKREVYLNGEAFFEVKRDESKPFVIHSGDLKTTVLGTSFNVKAFTSEENIEVAVVSGLVRVTTKNGLSFNVEPENMAVYKKSSQSLKKVKYDNKKVLGWKDGILYFSHEPLKEVFKKLESWYGVELKVSENIHTEDPYSGEFHNETLKNVLEGICYTSGLQFKINNDEVTIFKP